MRSIIATVPWILAVTSAWFLEEGTTDNANFTVEKQSAMIDTAERKKLVKEIDKKLQMDVVRPTITFAALPYCRRAHVKGYVPSMNSQYSNLRMEDVWLDR